MRKPNTFEDSLKVLDPLLSVRWGGSIGQWIIERRAILPQDEVEYLTRRKRGMEDRLRVEQDATEKADLLYNYQQVCEELISAKSNRRIIIYAKVLDRRIYDALCVSDIQRYGGYSRFADELERKEMKAEAARSKARSARLRDLNLETYDVLNFIHRKSESKLLSGEKDVNVLLHGRKRDESPVPTR